MISLICTNCQTELSIDDAFAGGVCRCQHCGTIQTVPSKRSGDAVASGVNALENSGGRSLYQTQAREKRSTEQPAGLEELADIVASSGLGGSGLGGSGLSSGSLRKKKSSRPAGVDAGSEPSRTPLIIAGATVIVIGIIAGAWLLSRPSATQSTIHADSPSDGSVSGSPSASSVGADGGGTVANASGGTGSASSVTGPQFCAMALSGSNVIYLLDRGDSASQIFDALKQATYASVASLGPERKFQIKFWDNHTDDASYPPTEMTYATPANLAACIKALDDVTAYHQSDIIAPLTRAVAESPDVIVIATAKGFELDDTFVSAVETIVKGTSIKLDTISLHGSDCPPLKTIAKNSGGSFKAVSDGLLRASAPE